jgi:biopolymer transport protein ExbD
MRFFTRKRRNPVPVILPLIDILAILLIFFIVTTTFKKNPPRLQINLPESATAVQTPAENEEPLLLQIKGEEEIALGDELVALPELAEALRGKIAEHPGRPLVMQADREAPFGVVVRVLDALREAGIQNIPAFTEPTAP